MKNLSRREVIKGAVVAGVSSTRAKLLLNPVELRPFASILRPPDFVRVLGADNQELACTRSGEDVWQGDGFKIKTEPASNLLAVSLQGEAKVARIQLRWRADLRHIKLYLGDQWERSYADLHWQSEAPNRVMPWYFMAFDGQQTHGYGVRTNPGALCFWTADCDGISLWADVRSGGMPVQLGDRVLKVAEVVCREGKEGESAFAATQAFCKQMCPNPRLPAKPVYGTNDWDYAYGHSSAELIEGMATLVANLSDDQENRPFSVIDEGWQMGPYENRFGYGPWVGNPNFGDMGKVASKLKSLGVRPGLWYRPLTPLANTPDSWLSKRDPSYLDPTIPEVQHQIAEHIQRFVNWGYELVKHDYSTFDILGGWGFEMGSTVTKSGWSFHDSSQTTAEVISTLYGTIRNSAGEALLIGCNTMTHLAAGTHEVQRTGDDTSGRSWDRTRRMGVNTLGFRAPQHETFYVVDPDIAAVTSAIPWPLAKQWLELVSQSGTALFVAVEPGILDGEKRATLKRAMSLAAKHQPTAEPLDWMETNSPRHWRLGEKEVNFDWMGKDGAWPFSD